MRHRKILPWVIYRPWISLRKSWNASSLKPLFDLHVFSTTKVKVFIVQLIPFCRITYVQHATRTSAILLRHTFTLEDRTSSSTWRSDRGVWLWRSRQLFIQFSQCHVNRHEIRVVLHMRPWLLSLPKAFFSCVLGCTAWTSKKGKTNIDVWEWLEFYRRFHSRQLEAVSN